MSRDTWEQPDSMADYTLSASTNREDYLRSITQQREVRVTEAAGPGAGKALRCPRLGDESISLWAIGTHGEDFSDCPLCQGTGYILADGQDMPQQLTLPGFEDVA